MVVAGRCDQCRKRKIKCDETRPVCSQCKRGKRSCTSTTRMRYSAASSAGGLDSAVSRLADGGDIELQLIESHEKASGKFHKFRIQGRSQPEGPVTSKRAGKQRGLDQSDETSLQQILSPPRSKADTLRIHFIFTFNPERGGINAVFHNEYLFESLPLNIGRSKALDNAAAYLIQTHQNLTQTITNALIVTPAARTRSHMKAIQSLQACLQDPDLASHDATLAAIGTLAFTEALGDFKQSSAQWVVHCKGFVNFLKATGPARNSGIFARSIIQAFAGCIIMFGALGHLDKILERPEWRDIAFVDPRASFVTQCTHRASRQLSRLSVLLEDIRCLGLLGETIGMSPSYIAKQLVDIRVELSVLDNLVRTDDFGICRYIELASPSGDTEVPEILHFMGNMDAAMACLTIWAVQILINAILVRLWDKLHIGEEPEMAGVTPLECELEILDRVECIARSAEWQEEHSQMVSPSMGAPTSPTAVTTPSPPVDSPQTSSLRQGTDFNVATDVPVCLTILPSQIAGGKGAMYMVLPLGCAFRFAPTAQRRAWILRKLPVGGKHAPQYSPERVDWFINMLIGEPFPYAQMGVAL